MAKTITFSTHFPAKHPKAGQPTYFVEKICKGLISLDLYFKESEFNADYFNSMDHAPKWHTIRSGQRFKAGNMFSPRIWSKAPYRGPQITIAPNLEIKKVWPIEILNRKVFINGVYYGQYSFGYNDPNILKLAINDGLSLEDFDGWFGAEFFHGQIICWSDKIDYSI